MRSDQGWRTTSAAEKRAITATPSTPSRIDTAWARPESSGVDQVDLAGIAGHRHARAFAQAGQHHLHLQARGVLGLVDDDEGVGQGAAAHEGDGRHLDLAAVAAAAQGSAPRMSVSASQTGAM